MNPSRHSNSAANSWRDIPQEVKPTVMSSAGRRRLNRQLIRNVLIGLLAVVLAGGAFEIWRTVVRDPQKFAAVAGSRPVEKILLDTNGVIDLAWVEQTLDLPRNAGLAELDIFAARERLMASGQVREAVLTRIYPATLKVTLDERAPVLRLRARQPGGRPAVFLVANDGFIYEGHGYAAGRLDGLPGLGGVGLSRAGNRFAAIEQVKPVAELLLLAREHVPELYATWRVVSLERFKSDRQILVQTTEVPEIVFSLEQDFYAQLARLDLIIERSRTRSLQPVQRIDLAIGGSEVPVSYRDGPIAQIQSPRSSSPAALVSFRIP